MRQVQGCQAGKLGWDQGPDKQGAWPGARHLQEGSEDESLSLKSTPKQSGEPHWGLATQFPPNSSFQGQKPITCV